MIRETKHVWMFAFAIAIAAIVLGLGLGTKPNAMMAAAQVLPLPGNDFNVFSEAEEIDIGNKFAKEIEKEEPIISDAAAQAYLDNLGQRLARNSPRSNIKYEFRLINTDDINAASIPGHVYVNKGLIAAAENEPELAGVIGHEIGHIVGRHTVKQLSKMQLAGGILGTAGNIIGLADKNVQQLFETVGGASVFLVSQKYSRDQEREADSTGLRTVVKTGLDPNGMVRFFKKLAAKDPGGDLVLFRSHPLPTERMQNVQAEINSMNLGKLSAGDDKAFRDFKTRVTAIRTPVEAPTPKK